MSKSWLVWPLLIAVSACGGKSDIEARYKKAVAEQRAKSGVPADQLVSIGMSVGQSGNDVAIVYYSGGDRHDLTGTATTTSGDRNYQIDGGGIVLKADDRSYGFKIVTADANRKVRWKVRLYPDKIKIADNDDDVAPRRIRTESPALATLAGPEEEALGKITFDGTNTVVTTSDGKVRYSKATGKLEPSYAVFLFDRMPTTEKYIVIAELMARNR
jgi:hypothetical protein